MALRMTGLMSGLDTESIVSALMKAQTMKKTKVDNKHTKLEWKKEAWSKVNTKLYNFYKGSLSKMRLQSSFLTKAASSSNTTKVTATASSTAANGTYAVKVNKLAAAQYVTSGKLDGTQDGSKVTSKTKLSDLKNASFAPGSQITVTGDKSITLNVDENTTVADFVSTLTKAGLNATFDESQQRFFISAKKSGEGSYFSIESKTLSGAQVTARDNLRNAVSYDTLSSSQKSTVNTVLSNLQNMPAGADTAAAKQSAVDTLIGVADAVAKATATNYYKEDLKNSYISSNGITTSMTRTDADGNQITDYNRGSADSVLLASGMTQTDIDALTQDDYNAKVSGLISNYVNGEISSETYQNNIIDAVENGLSVANIDSKADRKTNIESVVDNFVTEIQNGGVADATALGGTDTLNFLGLSSFDGAQVKDDKKEGEFGGSDMSIVAAKDSEIEFNGAKLTSSQTTMTISGLTLNLLSTTEGETVNINVTKDTTAVYDAIKDFLNEYNSVLQELNGKYNAASSRGYDVLTDEEKEAMTDDEIEKWETKIKDSLLRRDTTLGGLVTSLRTNMSGSYKASNGKTYSLANLGISTSAKDYSEGGLLHIKGDEDDTEFADSENKLKKMLEEDPDTVMEVITGLAGNLYTELGKKMQTSRLSSALTFYNDKEMNSQLSDYKKQIKKWETKLADMEDRYYKQFTAMEKAMASMQSQQNALSSYFGGGM